MVTEIAEGGRRGPFHVGPALEHVRRTGGDFPSEAFAGTCMQNCVPNITPLHWPQNGKPVMVRRTGETGVSRHHGVR